MKRTTRRLALLFLTALACAILAFLFTPSTRALALRSLAFTGPLPVSDWSIDRLEGMGSEGAESLDLIAADCESGRERRLRALTALSNIGAEAASASSALAEILDGDSDPIMRLFAVVALGDIGWRGSAAIPALTRALSDDDGDVAEWSARALESMRPPAEASLISGLDRGAECMIREALFRRAEAKGDLSGGLRVDSSR